MELKKGTTADTYINSAVTIIICFALSIFLFRLISVTPRSTHLKINNDNNDNDNDNDNDSDNNNNNRTLLKIVAYASNSSHDAKICHVSYNIRYLYFYPSKADTIGAKNTMSIIEKK